MAIRLATHADLEQAKKDLGVLSKDWVAMKEDIRMLLFFSALLIGVLFVRLGIDLLSDVQDHDWVPAALDAAVLTGLFLQIALLFKRMDRYRTR